MVDEQSDDDQPPDPADYRSHRRFLPGGNAASEEDEEAKKALDFNESDPAFRIFVCNYPIAPVFFVISMVKLLLLFAALLFTIAQLILHSTSSSVTMESNLTVSPQSTVRPRSDVEEHENGRRSSWASAIFYFEPSWWLGLAYLRLTVTVVAIFGVFCGLFGLWRQRRRFLLATAAADCGLLLFLLGYMALLAWHAVKYDDYFAFCIGGLTLLSLLLISVMGLHAAVVTHKYLRSMQSFLIAAKNRWPDAYDEAVLVVQRRCSGQNGLAAAVYHRLTRRYEVVGELTRIAAAELTVMKRPTKMVLHDIEEDERENEAETSE